MLLAIAVLPDETLAAAILVVTMLVIIAIAMGFLPSRTGAPKAHLTANRART